MKKYLFIPLTITLLLGLILTGCAEPEVTEPVAEPEPVAETEPEPEVVEAIVLSMAAPWPPHDPMGINCQDFVDRFNERAGGRYVIELHLGESLVTMGESFDAVRTKTVDIAGFPPGVFATVEPRFYAAEIPFLWDSARADGAGQKGLIPLYNEIVPDKYNQRIVGSLSGTALEILGNVPIKTMEDWDGVLFQSVSPQASGIIEKMGGSAVPIPFTEGYQALQKGTVDCTMVAPPAMIAFKMYEVAKYYTSGYLCAAPSCLSVNEDVFQAMPQDIKDLLMEEGINWSDQGSNQFIEGVDEERQFFRDNGVEVYVLPAEERERWREALLPVRDHYLGLMGEFGDRVLELADELNAQYPY